jgi:hypothetical protein
MLEFESHRKIQLLNFTTNEPLSQLSSIFTLYDVEVSSTPVASTNNTSTQQIRRPIS